MKPNIRLPTRSSTDGSICIWDAKIGEMGSGPFKGLTNSVLSIDSSSDGKQIASSSDDKSVCIWDVDTGQIFKSPIRSHKELVDSIGSFHSLSCWDVMALADRDDRGWVCFQCSLSSSTRPPRHIFWVPHLNCKGLCDIYTISHLWYTHYSPWSEPICACPGDCAILPQSNALSKVFSSAHLLVTADLILSRNQRSPSCIHSWHACTHQSLKVFWRGCW